MSRLPERLTGPLRDIARALTASGVRWRLGGSGLLAALGLTDEVNDLDVLVGRDARAAVEAACSGWIIEVEDGTPPAPWCNGWLARLEVGGVPADVVGGLCVVAPRGRVVVPMAAGGHLDVAGERVPLADPAVWWWVYRGYKPDRAALLETVVPVARRSAVERDLGPPPVPPGRARTP